MKENKNIVETQGVKATERAKTISLTAEQIREIGLNNHLAEAIATQIDDSEGNLKGNIAFAVGKAIIKQLNLDLV